MLPEIPPNLPPWLRELYEAEQLLSLAIDEESPSSEPISTEEVSRAIDNPTDVVWVWKDWPRAHFVELVDSSASFERSGGIGDLDEGRPIEIMTGGRSGLPSVVFPTGDPEMLSEAQPFEKREIVGRLHEFSGRHHIDRVPPLRAFSLRVAKD